MDMVWVDTMFPGIDEEDGWEKNLERVVNYDYLLKEYLDWQLKHLTTDNFDQVDWSKVEADIISMAAKSVDLTAYYTKDEADNKAQLTLQAAEDYVQTELGAYYTKTEIGDFTGYSTAVAALQAYADSAVASIDLSAYYTSGEVDGLISSSEATVKGYADGKIAGMSLAAKTVSGTAQLVLQSGGSDISGSGAALALSVTNNSTNGYSTLSLTSGGVTLATSGNITLGGKVVFTNTDISSLSSSSGIYQGVTEIIGDTVTTSFINALNITAKYITASASISSPSISGGVIDGSLIVGSMIYSSNEDSYFLMTSSGWALYQKTGSSWPVKASLEADSTGCALTLGNSTPVVLEKYFSNSTHYLWLGNSNRTHGLQINLSTGAYSFS